MSTRLISESDRGERAPTFFLLAQELKVARWHTLGTHLGMTEDEIREIEQDHPGDTARRRTAMLDKWLKKEESPSWVRVIEALESMSEVNLAKKIRKKYVNSEHRGEMPAKPRSRINLVQKLKKKIWFPAARQQPCAPARAPMHEAQQTIASTDKVHVVELHSSDAISQWIENLRERYFKLVKEMESDLESANPPSRDIRRFSQVFMCDEVSTVEDLFDQLKPFYIFDYALLEKISKFLLKQEQSVVSKLDDYIRELQEFKKSATVQQFMENIETAQKESPQTCTVTIQLLGSWLPKTISDLEKLLDELFHNKAAVLTRLKIVRKCILVTYLVQRLEAIFLIEAARPKVSFMKKVGVSVLKIGDTIVTSTQNETSDFSFESSLIKAVKDSDINVLRFLLNINTCPDASDCNGVTALIWGSYFNRKDATDLLLEANANPNVQRYGVTALFIACQNGNRDMCSLLLKANANPNLHSDDGVTPLFMASQNGHCDIVSLLLKANANPNLCRDDGVTPLFVASQNGHSYIVSLILNAFAKPNLWSNDGTTPLFMASLNGHSDIVSLLLNANAEPNLYKYNGITPLFVASQNGHSHVVSLLLNSNADPNFHSVDGVTPLIMASQDGHSDIVNLLLSAYANPNICRDNGVTPLIMASQNGHFYTVDLLLSANADPNLYNNDGLTPLALASQNGHSDIVSLLLKYNADPNLHSYDGATPLHLASQNGHIIVVDLLLSADANPNHQANGGMTPLMVACVNCYPQIVDLLLRSGANPDLQNYNNETALMIANSVGCFKSAELLEVAAADFLSQQTSDWSIESTGK